eukprot:9763465-Alexandrium_andersonii.AAC.1
MCIRDSPRGASRRERAGRAEEAGSSTRPSEMGMPPMWVGAMPPLDWGPRPARASPPASHPPLLPRPRAGMKDPAQPVGSSERSNSWNGA